MKPKQLPLLVLAGTALLSPCTKAAATDNNTGDNDTYIQMADSAQFHIKAGNWAEAERCLLTAIRTRPADSGNLLLWSNLGIVRCHQEDYTGALDAYDAGLARAPRSTVLLSNKAFALLATGQRKQAMTCLTEVLQADSLLRRPRLVRGMINLGDRNYTDAAADFSFALRHDRNCSQAMAGLGQCLQANGDSRKALELYDRAIDTSPCAEYHCLRGRLKADLEMLSEARADVTQAIREYPESADLYMTLAYINQLSHLNAEAESAYRTAIRLGADPKDFYPQAKSTPDKNHGIKTRQ